MKTFTNLLFSFFIFSNLIFAQNSYKPLFKIYENGLYGYIDSTGAVIIPPKFKGAGEFSEGLAPVRENGYYGYIDESGKYDITPLYDYATNFGYGYAIVYKDGTPNLIDKYGKNLTSTRFKNIFPFEKNMAKVVTFSGKFGIINTQDRLIIDTAYKEITPFNDGISIVIDYNSQFSAIDTSGKRIVKPGVYHRINNFSKGFAKVFCNEMIDGISSNCDRGYINTIGELVFSQKLLPGSDLSDYVSHDSLFILTENPYEGKSIYSLMDMKGNVIKKLDNKSFQMNKNVIYILDSNSLYHEVDSKGNANGNKVFLDGNGNIHKIGFKADTLFGLTLFGIIDTSLKYIVMPSFTLIYNVLNSENLIFSEFLKDSNGNYIFDDFRYNIRKYGIITNTGEILLNQTFDDFDFEHGFVNGLLLCKIEGKTAYVNQNGKIVWHQASSNEPRFLDIDYKLQTWYSVDPDGWKPLKEENTDSLNDYIEFNENNPSMVLKKNEKSIFHNEYAGISLYLINDCKHAISVPSVDGALYLLMEAKDKNGEWRRIETHPSKFFHSRFQVRNISPKHYLKYSIPEYSGGFNTKLRAVLQIYDKKEKLISIYSDEISGSINPAQFWRENSDYQQQGYFEKTNLKFEQ
jgi:hypothetical protein